MFNKIVQPTIYLYADKIKFYRIGGALDGRMAGYLYRFGGC